MLKLTGQKFASTLAAIVPQFVGFSCFNISDTITASDFKIYPKVSLDSLYISTGNDILNYFQLAANHTNVNCGSCSGRDFTIMVQPILKRLTFFGTVIQAFHFSFSDPLDILVPLPQKCRLKWTYRRLRVTYKTQCDFHVILLCITKLADVMLLLRSTRPCESMPGHAHMFSEQVIASIIDAVAVG